jgi:hypothetical protein
MTAQPHTSRRILVVANETGESPIFAEAIGSDVDSRGAPHVLVVAPALNSRLRHWATDDGAAVDAPEARLRRCLDQLAAVGVEAEGTVGDAESAPGRRRCAPPLPADELLIATHSESRSNWLARDVVGRAWRAFDVPVTHVIVDEDDAYGRAGVSRRQLLGLAGAAGATLVAGSKGGGQLWSELRASLGSEPAAAADARALACVLSDAAGLYSDVSANGTVGRKFLRGYQITDASGSVEFHGSDGSQLLVALASDGAGGYVGTYDVGLSELPSRSLADTAVNASLAATRWTRTSSGSRVLQLTLDLDETVSAELRLLRAGRTIARRRYPSLGAGTRRATLPIGGGVAAGGARLRLVLEDAAGNTRVVQRAVQVPRRAS